MGRTDAETLFYAIRYGAVTYLTRDVEPAALVDQDVEQLMAHEVEILERIAQGQGAKEIA